MHIYYITRCLFTLLQGGKERNYKGAIRKPPFFKTVCSVEGCLLLRYNAMGRSHLKSGWVYAICLLLPSLLLCRGSPQTGIQWCVIKGKNKWFVCQNQNNFICNSTLTHTVCPKLLDPDVLPL